MRMPIVGLKCFILPLVVTCATDLVIIAVNVHTIAEIRIEIEVLLMNLRLAIGREIEMMMMVVAGKIIVNIILENSKTIRIISGESIFEKNVIY